MILRYCRGILGALAWVPFFIFSGFVFTVRIVRGASLAWQTDFAQNFYKRSLWLWGIGLKISGETPSLKPGLVVSNHQSLLDIPVAFTALPVPLRMVAKKELFGIPFFGWVLRESGFISVDRKSSESRSQVLRDVPEKIRAGYSVWMAPEGTRSTDGQLLPFKKGAFDIAVRSGLPIQPLVVLNAHEALPKSSFVPRSGVEIRVHILPVFVPQPNETTQQLLDRVRSAMAQVLIQNAIQN